MAVEKALEILDKMEFFGGQRAGRELWNDKPKEIQDKDIEDFCRDLQVVRSALKDADPVRHGRWIEVDIVSNYMWKYHCSCCHSDGERRYNYCPNCGAKMDEVQ